MQANRAQEILNSSQEIEVTYQGTPIWITNVDTTNNKAQVKMPSTSNNLVEVSVNDLIEL